MATVIREGRIANDSWRLLDAEIARLSYPAEDGLLPDFPANPELIVPLALWRRRREDLLERGGRLGVRLAPEDTAETIVADLGHFDLVAVEFPVFTDGRGYSTGRLLRERFGFRGELRAVGDVLHDQLLALYRCGFDAFALREDHDAEAARAAFHEISSFYQGDARDSRPLFRRRVAAEQGALSVRSGTASERRVPRCEQRE
ncbi:MAG: DUF934 domain-containing protein [Betaproteobacteria bacterium]|nr:DUF934 domain-containing protein [Betaproteobacteria bacterium]